MSSQLPSPLPPNTSRGPLVLCIVWTETCIAVVVVALRIYFRTIPSVVLGWDDYTILAALASNIVGSSLITLQVRAGYGRHVYYLSKAQLIETAKWTASSEIHVVIGVCFVKVSVCFFVLRMIAGTNKAIRQIFVGFMITLSFLTVANVLLLCLQCIPIQGFWDPEIKAHCIKPSDVEKISKAFSAFGVVTDFLCVLLPLFIIRGVQMNPRTKVAIGVVLGLGTFTAVCSIAKTVLIKVRSQDMTWELVPVEIWASLEESLGIIIASIPPLRRRVASINKIISRGPLVNNRNLRATEKGSDIDHLVPIQDIQVTKPPESKSRARRPSDAYIASESVILEHWRVNGETATESV